MRTQGEAIGTQVTAVRQAFASAKQYVVPSYQRNYVWTQAEQWKPLWDDLMALTERGRAGGSQHAHFLGTIITRQLDAPSGYINPWSVVDGQQRLTTLLILIAAARVTFGQHGLDRYASMLSRILANDEEDRESEADKYKIKHKSSDYEGFRSIIDVGLGSSSAHVPAASRLGSCYAYFRTALETWIEELDKGEVEAHVRAFNKALLDKLVVVDIRLLGDQNSHAIFEALNARGEPLAEWEKTKSYILSLAVRKDDPDGDRTYEKHLERYDGDPYWNEMVSVPRFSGKRIDLFLFYFAQLEIPRQRRMLSGKPVTRPLPRNRIYREFRYIGEHYYRHDLGHLESMLARLGCYADIYKRIDQRREKDFSDHAREAMRHRQVLNLASLVPVFMELVAKLGYGEQLDDALRIVDSYLMRRVALKLRYSGFDDVAFRHVQALRDAPADEMHSVLVKRFEESSLPNRWPADVEIKQGLPSANMYHGIANARVQMLLRGIAQHMHSKREHLLSVPFSLKPLTVEHVAPRNWTRHWQESLGFQDSEEDRHRLYQLVHRIGNLTLVTRSMNSKLGDKDWGYKAKLLKGDNLELNKRLVADMDGTIWNEAEIDHRSRQLAGYVTRIWPHADILRRELGISALGETPDHS